MDHSLVSPLVEQRGYRVFLAIQNKQDCRIWISGCSLHEFILLINLLLEVFRNIPGNLWVVVKSNRWITSRSHHNPKESFNNSISHSSILHRPLFRVQKTKTHRRPHIKRKEVFINSLEVSKYFLDTTNDIESLVSFSKLLKSIVVNSVWEIWKQVSKIRRPYKDCSSRKWASASVCKSVWRFLQCIWRRL